MILSESMQIHDTLNKKLFDLNNKLYPEVREKLLEISKYFIDSMPIKLDILDIQLLGSNASFNYTEQSDLDVHIIVNFDDIDGSQEVLRALFNGQKNTFKEKYKITVKGYEVELYVEDMETDALSNGRYSLIENDWIKFPKKIKVPQYDLTTEVIKWQKHIDKVLKSADVDTIKDTISRLFMMRKNSIAIDGEFGKGNQIFKELRNMGYIDKLKQRRDFIIGDDLTLESLI